MKVFASNSYPIGLHSDLLSDSLQYCSFSSDFSTELSTLRSFGTCTTLYEPVGPPARYLSTMQFAKHYDFVCS